MKSFRMIIPAACMAILILDTQTALSGAQAGLELCIRSVIPSLFPFLFLSAILTGGSAETVASFLSPLGRLCRIPAGAESIMAVGLIGGYPVGAQCIAQAYRDGRLDRETARRMLGFCSNAGPSFIFGFLSPCFTPQALWLLWVIHILSAVFTGMLLPGGSQNRIPAKNAAPVSAVSALDRSLRTMALICGWVTVFRVILTFLRKWFLWMLPGWADILVSGVLELTNGCSMLSLAEPAGSRFILASGLLSLGGVCVWLQTASVTHNLGTGFYVPGKLIQSGICILLSAGIQYWIYPERQRLPLQFLLPVVVLFAAGITTFYISKKHSSNLARQGV